MKDTARLIMFLDCNLSCPYCCNKRQEVNSQFKKVSLYDIDFSPYPNVCVTGGEPFLKKFVLYTVLDHIPRDKKVYIYSNGLLIDSLDFDIIQHNFPHVKGLSVGLHSVEHVRSVVDVEHHLPTRFLINEHLKTEAILANPGRLNETNCKVWVMNKCDKSNEDWYYLNM